MEEERPRRQKRGTAEILRCYPVPIHFQNATLLNSQYYFSAELPMSELRAPTPFCVGESVSRQTGSDVIKKKVIYLITYMCTCVCAGDNRTYSGYWNAPLLPHKSYGIYYQAVSSANGVSLTVHMTPSLPPGKGQRRSPHTVSVKVCGMNSFVISKNYIS